MRATHLVSLLWLAACAGGGDASENPAVCEAGCPDGTRGARYEAVVRGQAGVVAAGECESVCEPITSCLAPQVPVISADSHACVSIDGISGIPADAEVDFSFTEAWAAEESR